VRTKPVPVDQQKREQFFATVGQHLPELYDWLRHEIAALEASGDLVPGELAPEEIVDAVVLHAYQDFVRNPMGPPVLRLWSALPKKRLGVEVGRLKDWRSRMAHTEENLPQTPPQEEVSTMGDEILDFFEPDEKLKLEDVLPDLEVPGPDQEVEAEELRSCVLAALAGMPKDWRRVFVLNQIADYDGAQLAKAAGKPPHEVERILEHARQYLRQRLVEMGCMFKTEGSQAS
jgi:RNA polymerase sigma factor (sigma-70 family)